MTGTGAAAAAADGALSALGISKKMGARAAVANCSFTVQRGKIVGLFGPNGAGKTTSFYMLAGLVRPEAGRVLLDGQDVTAMSLAQRARLGLRYLPQENSIFGSMTVKENILAVLEIGNVESREKQRRCAEVIDLMNLSRLAGVKGAFLSGGERRRVEIARCLAIQPRYILLDEPTVGLDPITVRELLEVIRMVAAQGVGIMVTDHNVKDVMPIVDCAYVMYMGEIIASGAPQLVAEDPAVRRIYLG